MVKFQMQCFLRPLKISSVYSCGTHDCSVSLGWNIIVILISINDCSYTTISARWRSFLLFAFKTRLILQPTGTDAMCTYSLFQRGQQVHLITENQIYSELNFRLQHPLSRSRSMFGSSRKRTTLKQPVREGGTQVCCHFSEHLRLCCLSTCKEENQGVGG